MKRICVTLMSLILIVTFMPATSFGMSITDINRTFNSRVRVATDDLDYMKQVMIELVDESLDSSLEEDRYYCPEVLAEIDALTAEIREKIQNAESPYEFLASSIDGEYSLVYELEELLSEVTALAGLTKQQVSGSGDLKRMKADLQTRCKESFGKLKRSKYDAYYWGFVEEDKKELLQDIAAIKTFRDYVITESDLTYYEDMIEESVYSYEDDEEIDDDWEDYDDDEGDGFYFFNWIYTIKEVNDLQAQMIKAVDDYINKDLKNYGYKGKATAFKSIVTEFQKKIKTVPDVEAKYQCMKDAIRDINKKAGIDPDLKLISDGDRIRMLAKLKDVYFQYKQSNYCNTNWFKMENIYYKARRDVQKAFLPSSLTDKLVTNLKKELDKVPTEKTALPKARKQAKKQLKKYLNKKKYNLKKSKPIVKAGYAAINKCKYSDEVPMVAMRYIAKAERTLRKFTIRTKAKGPGKVTKTKKASYGDYYTVKFTPKAGHRIKTIKVDGKKIKLKNSYLFKNVKKPHKVVVVFQ